MCKFKKKRTCQKMEENSEVKKMEENSEFQTDIFLVQKKGKENIVKKKKELHT